MSATDNKKTVDQKPTTAKPCPNCGKSAVRKYRPFCSSRCRTIDLGHWLDGSYAIPAVESDDDTDDGYSNQTS